MSISTFRSHPLLRKYERAPRVGNNLSSKEIQIIKHLADGKTTGQIAALMGHTHSTIETYRGRMCRMLDLSGACALVAYALRNKLIE